MPAAICPNTWRDKARVYCTSRQSVPVGGRPLNEGKAITYTIWETEVDNAHINKEAFQWGADLTTGGKEQLSKQAGVRGQSASSV